MTGGQALSDAAPTVPVVELDDDDRAMLALERGWWHHQGAKAAAIRDRFGISETVYYQRLNALIDRPAALVAEPTLVKRLRRLRATRQQQRTRVGR